MALTADTLRNVDDLKRKSTRAESLASKIDKLEETLQFIEAAEFTIVSSRGPHITTHECSAESKTAIKELATACFRLEASALRRELVAVLKECGK